MDWVCSSGSSFQSGGFFIHFAVGEEGVASVGTMITRIGAVVLAAALVTLGVGLLRARQGAGEP